MLLKLIHSLTLCLALITALELHAEEQRYNVLMIIVDDLAPVVSAYGGPVSTPSIDQLAAEGVRFTNNYANVPVCGASRASMLSGLAPTTKRFLSYDSRLDKDVPNSVSLPEYFRQHGWHTVANGKIFDVIADSAESWSEPVWSPNNVWHGKQPDGRGEHLQAAYIDPPSGRRLPYFERLEVIDTAYPDGQVAAKTVADLQRLAGNDTPFFLAVGFRKPHLPFNAPEKYWQPVKSPEDMLPVTWRERNRELPASALHRSPELRGQYDALPMFGDPSDKVASEIVRAYHAAVRYVDAQVGHVLAGLADSGAADRTLVMLLGDHGFLLGEQRLWTKHALFEPALRTPLILAHPQFPGGQQARSVTDLLDVFPTLAELAGLQIPAHLEGESLLPLMENPASPERQNKLGSISRWMNGESVRRADYRYTRWLDEQGNTTEEMLFDLASDPFEQSNLAGDPEFADVTIEMATYLSDQRSGPAWSAELDKQYNRWRLASSATGAVLLFVLAYPVPVIVALLFVIVAIIFGILRYRRKRMSAAVYNFC